jgi:hypothetical protein
MNSPAVAFRSSTAYPGQCYIVVWVENHDGDYELWARRTRPDGSMIDPSPFFVTSLGSGGTRECGITSDGDRFLVVWNEVMTGGYVKAVLLAADDAHTVTQLPSVYDVPYPVGIPNSAYDLVTHTYQVVWRLSNSGQIWSRTLDADGLPVAPAFAVEPLSNSVNTDRPGIASGGVNFVAVWDGFVVEPEPHFVAFWRGLADGAPVTSQEAVFGQTDPSQWNPSIAPNRDDYPENYMVAWQEPDGIYADTVSFWQRHFYSNSYQATYGNAGRSIVLDPATGWLHMVYEDVAVVYYTYSTDGGSHWWPTEAICNGRNACVACEGQGGPVWVSCLAPPVDEPAVRTAVRLGRSQWQMWQLAYDVTSPPSMDIRYDPAGPEYNPSVYVVYARSVGLDREVVCNTVSLLYGVSPAEQVRLSGEALGDPSVSVTPGDVVHVTWTDAGSAGRKVYYRQRTSTGWDPLVEEVTGSLAPPECKPAYHASVEAYGDRVYAMWNSKLGPANMGEVWSAWRDPLVPLSWTDWQNLSNNPTTSSDYPQQSTHWACVWQDPVSDPSNEDIWGHILGLFTPIAQDQFRSQYPDIAAEWSAPGEPLGFKLYTAWTSETPTGADDPYEVLFKRKEFNPDMDGFSDFAYYDCGVGDSVKSRYCLARDGFARWRDYNVDFGRKSLRYQLPFLNPNYDYKLRALLYQASKDTWQQTFVSDSVPLASVRLRPLVPETVWIDIPRDQYAKDCKVALDINKLAGQFAAVAELKLYECFPYNKGEGGPQSGTPAVSPSATRVSVPRPSLFRDVTSLSYTVATPRRVSVDVYDSQGRRVRRLVSGSCARGTHFVRWNGLDDSGRRAPVGAYMLRVESEGFSQTRKVVLTR